MKRFVVVAVAVVLFGSYATAQEMDKKEILNKLNIKIDCDYDNMPFTDVIENIKQKTGITNIVIDPEIGKAAEGEGSKVTIKLKGVNAKTALKVILGMSKYAAVYKDGALKITTEEKAKANVYAKVYNIKDLTFAVSNFPGPRVDLLPPDSYKEKFGNLGGGGALQGNTFSLSGGSEESPLNTDFIITVLKNNTTGGEAGWTDPSNIEEKSGMLIVTAPDAKHKEVVKLLALLRQFK